MLKSHVMFVGDVDGGYYRLENSMPTGPSGALINDVVY